MNRYKPDALTQRMNEQLEITIAPVELTELPDQPDAPPPPNEPGARVESINGPDGAIPLFIYEPEEVRGVYVFIHGGGWFGGSHTGPAPAMMTIARQTRTAAIGIDYRLAPKHPYPAAPDDCEVFALWLLENASKMFGTDSIVLSGHSAGAHLAVVTLLRLRDRHGIDDPFLGLVLKSGIYDLRLTPSARLWPKDKELGLSRPLLDLIIKCFAGDADLDDPDVSPLLADLRGVPPALFIAGTKDPLVDDTLFLHARWKSAQPDTELFVAPYGSHGFGGQDTPDGELARSLTNTFVSRCVS